MNNSLQEEGGQKGGKRGATPSGPSQGAQIYGTFGFGSGGAAPWGGGGGLDGRGNPYNSDRGARRERAIFCAKL